MFQVFGFVFTLCLSILSTLRYCNSLIDTAKRGFTTDNSFEIFILTGFFWTPTLFSMATLSTFIHENYYYYYH